MRTVALSLPARKTGGTRLPERESRSSPRKRLTSRLMADEEQIAEASERITALTKSLLEYLQEDIEGDFNVGTVAVVFEIDQEDENNVYYACSDPRQWVQVGLLGAARDWAATGERF